MCNYVKIEAGGKFCPDYGLLLELHALTLVAALEQVVHNYVTILPQASLRPGIWNVWPLLIKMPWLFARHSLVRIEVGAEPYKRESLPVETKPELSHSVLSVSRGGRARHHVGFQSWALPTLMWAGYLSSLPRCGEQKNIDTHPFREAIWYYIHSIKGIRHDDYHYRKVPALLHHHLVDIWLHYCIRSTTSLNLWARMCCKVVSGCDPPMQYIWVPEVHFALVNGIEIHSGMVQLSDCQHSMLVCFLPLILWCWS